MEQIESCRKASAEHPCHTQVEATYQAGLGAAAVSSAIFLYVMQDQEMKLAPTAGPQGASVGIQGSF